MLQRKRVRGVKIRDVSPRAGGCFGRFNVAEQPGRAFDCIKPRDSCLNVHGMQIKVN